jgi:hypothetical protein
VNVNSLQKHKECEHNDMDYLWHLMRLGSVFLFLFFFCNLLSYGFIDHSVGPDIHGNS